MNRPVGNYYQGNCYIRVGDQITKFNDEYELERFVMRCKHEELFVTVDGIRVCHRCWAIPWKVPV